MAMAWALALVVVAESLTAATLVAAVLRVRLIGDRRLAVEAELALGTTLAEVRIAHDSALAALPAGASVVLPPPAVAGWETRVRARREPGSLVVWLEASVVRRDGAARPIAARRGTLLLVTGSADTAIVLGNRPRW